MQKELNFRWPYDLNDIQVGAAPSEFAVAFAQVYREIIATHGRSVVPAAQFLTDNAQSTEELQRLLADVVSVSDRDINSSLLPIKKDPENLPAYKLVRQAAQQLQTQGVLPESTQYPTIKSPPIAEGIQTIIETITSDPASNEPFALICKQAAQQQMALLSQGEAVKFRNAKVYLDKIRALTVSEQRLRQGKKRAPQTLRDNMAQQLTQEQMIEALTNYIFDKTLRFIVERAMVSCGRKQMRKNGDIDIPVLTQDTLLQAIEIAQNPDIAELYSNVWSRTTFFGTGYSPVFQESIPGVSPNGSGARNLRAFLETANFSRDEGGGGNNMQLIRFLKQKRQIDLDCNWFGSQVDKEPQTNETAQKLLLLLRRLDGLSWPKSIDGRDQLRSMLWQVATGKIPPVQCLSFDCFPVQMTKTNDVELVLEPEKIQNMKTFNPTDNELAICDVLAESGLVAERNIFLPTDEILYCIPEQLAILGGESSFIPQASILAQQLTLMAAENFSLPTRVVSFADILTDPATRKVFTEWFDFVYDKAASLVNNDDFEKDIAFRMNGRYPIPIPREKAIRLSNQLTALYAAEIAVLTRIYGNGGFLWIQNEPDLFTFRLNLPAKRFTDQFLQFPLIYSIGKRPKPDESR